MNFIVSVAPAKGELPSWKLSVDAFGKLLLRKGTGNNLEHKNSLVAS